MTTTTQISDDLMRRLIADDDRHRASARDEIQEASDFRMRYGHD